MKSTIRGMFLLGKGKQEGLQEFSNTTDGVLSALAPWLAIAFVGNILPLLLLEYKNIHSIYIGISSFLVKITCLLVGVVIIHTYSTFWKKEVSWKQTVTAVLWCRWVPIIDCILFFMIFGFVFIASPYIFFTLVGLIAVLYVAYTIWLNWFVVKVGLGISSLNSVIVVITMIIVSFIIYGVFVACNYNYIVQSINDVYQQQMHQNGQIIK